MPTDPAVPPAQTSSPNILTVIPAAGWRSRLSALRGLWKRHGPEDLIALLSVLDALMLFGPYAPRLVAVVRAAGEDLAALRQLANIAVFAPVIAAVGLMLMATGLALRARVAWVMSLLLLALIAGLEFWRHGGATPAAALSLALLALLVFYWRRFDHSSAAAGGLFALLAVGSLLIFSVLGTLYFGDGFAPPVHRLVDAVYFSIETMSTVGYGDIVPKTDAARLFTASLIVMGITVFATSLSVVIGPLVGGNLKRIMQGRFAKVNRKDHFVILGASPLAVSLFRQLQARGVPITVIAPPNRELSYPPGTDLVVGDGTDAAVLRAAGVDKARAVLTLRDDDAENAFAVLAIKEVAPQVKTVAAVNDARHLHKIQRVQPDVLFAPQLLGSELLVRSLFDEDIDNELIFKLLFQTR